MKFTDEWPIHIPDNKLEAYKQLIDEGMITNPHVVYNRATGITIVEYSSHCARKVVREELKKRSEAS